METVSCPGSGEEKIVMPLNFRKACLRKTAMSLPKAVVKEAVMNMKVRVKQCIDADGGLFE